MLYQYDKLLIWLLVIRTLCLKSIDKVQTLITADHLELDNKKLIFIKNLGRMTPGKDPSDPLVVAI